MIILGDCIKIMATLDTESVDAIITDPPYGLEFMGKSWDRLGGDTRQIGDPTFVRGDARHGSVRYGGASYGQDAGRAGRAIQAWHEAWARAALRVLKPGGHLLAFGGTRTHHRLMSAIEDAGFEIRDCVSWMYGSGFPKSLNVSKAIDKAAGAKREIVGQHRNPAGNKPGGASLQMSVTGMPEAVDITANATPEAERWAGWGTALKPGWEAIVVARKPLIGTVAANVLAHSTGALNIDACRIVQDGGRPLRESLGRSDDGTLYGAGLDGSRADGTTTEGRWPANVVLSHADECVDAGDGWVCVPGCPVRMLDDQTGTLTSGGGASRFFYCPKTSRSERNAGLDGFEECASGIGDHRPSGDFDQRLGKREGPKLNRNHHPTVKPVNVMRWLVRLVTPPDGIVLDPFAGSGTTGIAAQLEGFEFIGIENDAEYVEIAEARLAHWRKVA